MRTRENDAPFSFSLCSYNSYKYGIAGGLTASLYTAPLANDPSALASQVALYPFHDVRYIFGNRDVCACNTPGYQNAADTCYSPTAGCLPNAYGGPGCCDTLPDSVSNAEAHGCEDLLQVRY